METAAQLYSPEWFANQKFGAMNSAFGAFPSIIKRLGKIPEYVIDVGCGVGAWLYPFLLAGAKINGIDGEWVDKKQLFFHKSCFCEADLETTDEMPFFYGIYPDLILCLETAEHLTPARAEPLVKMLCKNFVAKEEPGHWSETSANKNLPRPVILFSAATPGQGGTGHFNEQPEEYWIALFAKYCYQPDYEIREAIANIPCIEHWYRKNIISFHAI